MFYGNRYYKIWLLWNNSKNISTVALRHQSLYYMRNPSCAKYRNLFDLYFPVYGQYFTLSLICIFPNPCLPLFVRFSGSVQIRKGYDSVHIPENRYQRKPVCWYNSCTTFLLQSFIMIWAKTLLEILRNSTNLLLLHSYN